MKDVQISVIVPIYNAEKYLDRLIKSILAQSFNNIEAILVNDGSTDSSAQICNEYARIHPQIIKVIHQDNMRQAHARNQGLKIAKGKYICFVDADDYIDNQFLEKLYFKAEKHDADIAVANVTITPEHIPNYVGHWSFFKKDKVVLVSAEDKFGCMFSCAIWNKIYRKSLLDKNNISFDEHLFLEDVAFTLETVALSNRIVLCADAVYHYDCSNEQSFMHSAHKNKKVMDMLKMTQHARERLTNKCTKEYFSLLDSFEIFNLYGWFAAIEDRKDKEEFFIRMKKIFKSIDITENPFILPDIKEQYLRVINASCSKELVYGRKYSFLARMIKAFINNRNDWCIGGR